MKQKKLPTYGSKVEDLIPFSKVRLIVADLDGTLIDSNEIFGNFVFSLRNSMRQHRVGFTIATGRTLTGVLYLIKKLKITKGTPLILYNGSIILKNGTFEVITRKTIPTEVLKEIISIAKDRSLNVLAYYYLNEKSQKLDYTIKKLKDFEFVLGWTETKVIKKDSNGMNIRWCDQQSIPTDILPSSILVDTRNNPKYIEYLTDSISKLPFITVTNSGSHYIEIRPKESNKGNAIEEISTLMEYKREEILAIGDNDNDSELLSWAGIGIAVKNSSKKALESSDYVCEHSSQAGVIQTLRLIKAAKHFYS